METVISEVKTSNMGQTDTFSYVPVWANWISTIVLTLVFIIGLPLNSATVLIFCRRKKLRHLVNFVLLLDCLSHIVLCLFCIPLHLVSEWSGSSAFVNYPGKNNFFGVANLQHLIGNFVNLYSTFLTLSIAILRYRRLCWKKKDKFSTMNALKWSVSTGIVAVGVTLAQCYVVLLPAGSTTISTIYCGKISVILLAIVTVFFCYIRVSQRVWANTANQEKTMDPAKLKKSRSVHLRATIHSCVQILLVILTVTPHLYLQAVEMLSITSNPGIWSTSLEETSKDKSLEEASSAHHHLHHHNKSVSRHQRAHHHDLSDFINDRFNEDLLRSFSLINNNNLNNLNNSKHSKENYLVEEEQKENISGGNPFEGFAMNQLAKIFAITLNYALLVLGTPCAYIASCHRFREQFTSILFSHAANSPPNSTCHHHQQGHHPNSSPGHKSQRYHYNRSTTGGTQDACFSSPLTKTDRTSTTLLHNSLISKASTTGTGIERISREAVSISGRGSSFSHSFKSRSSVRKSSSGCGSMRRGSSTGVSITGKSLLPPVTADSVFIESESPLILEDLSNESSENLKPSPSPTTTVLVGGGEEVSAREPTRALVRKSSNHLPLTTITTITGTSTCLHTYVQSYDYGCDTDLGQLV